MDILPLRYMWNLADLNLSGNQIRDFTPIAHLSNLTRLTLSSMGLADEDIEQLRHMTNLTDMSLDGNRIRSIAPLANLTNLVHLSLSDNMIRDFAPVAHVANVNRGMQRLSSIVLPNIRLTDAERNEWIADYWAHGGPTENELAVLRYVNIERVSHGLVPVEIDNAMMMAARFYAQQFRDLRDVGISSPLGHNNGPYATDPSARHGASANVASAFGVNLRWGGGNGHGGGTTSAEGVVRDWMNSDGHHRYILSEEHRFMGFGQYPGGISYLFFAPIPSN